MRWPGFSRLANSSPPALGLALVFLLWNAVGAAWARPAIAPLEKKETFSTLCGRLVFITVRRTEQKLIGLQPCGKAQPYIFDAGPGTLHNYYRFHDVVAQDGPEIISLEFGRLGMYITKFASYEPIDSCSGCARQAPTRTPNPQRAAENCGEYLLQAAAERFPEVAAVESQAADELSRFRTGGEPAEICGADEACQSRAIARHVGGILGRSAERTAARRDELIGLLADTIKDPAAVAVCRDLPALARYTAAGLSEEGFAIDALSITSPATHWVSEAGGRTAGFLESGAVIEEIDGSRVVVTSQNKLILLPGYVLIQAAARGVGAGQAAMELTLNRDGQVWLAAFENVPFSLGSIYLLDFGPLPVLQLGGSSSAMDAAASAVEQLPAARWLPTPTAAPTVTFTPTTPPPTATATATARPSAMPEPTSAAPTADPAPPPNVPTLPCTGGLSLAAFAAGLWIIRRGRISI